MFLKNTVLSYALCTVLSTGRKNFENMGRTIKKSGDTIARILRPADESYDWTRKIARNLFAKKKRIIIALDGTFIWKVFSQQIQGTCYFYNTKIQKEIRGLNAWIWTATDGKYTIPLGHVLRYSKEFQMESKLDVIKRIILEAHKLFPEKEIVFVADGEFATIEIIRWCSENNVKMVMRMATNRVVDHKNERIQVRNIVELLPKGRQKVRTIATIWNKIPVNVTAERRRNKHKEESIVYLIATFKTKPSDYAKIYRCRWGNEKMHRTAKQNLGLSDCCSTNLQAQNNHIAAVLLAYALVQSERKRLHLDSPEQAIRALERKKFDSLIHHFTRYHHSSEHVYA
jgi:hypothetical protein